MHTPSHDVVVTTQRINAFTQSLSHHHPPAQAVQLDVGVALLGLHHEPPLVAAAVVEVVGGVHVRGLRAVGGLSVAANLHLEDVQGGAEVGLEQVVQNLMRVETQRQWECGEAGMTCTVRNRGGNVRLQHEAPTVHLAQPRWRGTNLGAVGLGVVGEEHAGGPSAAQAANAIEVAARSGVAGSISRREQRCKTWQHIGDPTSEDAPSWDCMWQQAASLQRAS